MADQTGKIFIITGANSGLGFEATKELVKKNATVIMTSRSLEKGNQAKQDILEVIPDAKIELMILDLSSLKSIREFGEEFNNKFDRIDALINNAGVMQPPKTETADGFELQIGVNHLGHYALTALLLEKLKSTDHSRIILQSSIAARSGKINFEDIQSEKKYNRTGAYSQSKLANILFAFELDKKLKENNIENVISLAVHPGYTATNLQHNGPTLGGKSIWSRLYTITNKIMAQNVKKGILPMLYAATASDVEGGDYVGPNKFAQTRGFPKRIKAPKAAYNTNDAEKLWEISETLTGIIYNF